MSRGDSEVGQCAARAAVYIDNGGWQAADTGLSNIDVYLNPSAASYRVVALDATNPASVSINSNVWAELTYTKASSTFHQWRDQAGRTYGLNFATQKDADTFERGMTDAVSKLKQGGGGAMAGLNLMSRESSAGQGAARPPQRAASTMGQGAQMRGGAAMMMTMPKDMGAAFDQQREADIAAFRQMSAAKKAGPSMAAAPPSPSPSRAPPGPVKAPSSGPPPITSAKPSGGGGGGWGDDVNNGGDDSGGGGGDVGNEYGDDGGGGGGGGDEEFTDAEIEAWRDSVIEAARAEIEGVKQELIDAVSQWYANGGAQGGGGGGGGGYGEYDQSYDQNGGW